MKAILALSILGLLPLQAGETGKKEGTRVVDKVVTVGGHVRRPGPVRYHPDVTLYTAIQSAGGATEFGAVNRVKLIRGGKMTRYDLRNDKQKVIRLQDGDVIEIPQKNFFGR